MKINQIKGFILGMGMAMSATLVHADSNALCGETDVVHTLAMTGYHEARSQGVEGMQAVMEVVLQRTNSVRWPDTVCEVVYQPSSNIYTNPTGCAFSFTCDGSDLATKEVDKYVQAVKIATNLVEKGFHNSITFTADHYIRCDIKDNVTWLEHMTQTVRIKDHCFYKAIQ